ncbi:MAG: hypothetical protein DRJ98_08090 [Thermoprotei archaeon]|nr:MAG: hypothetical protein DRJ59_01280 [Thermoprotei archaeon]RLF09465.1 MAG: hypothetical protein DRJ98_08090 [Thermoprotei archaeon]
MQLLNILKKMDARSYDELLRRLATENLNILDSMFISNPRLSPFRGRTRPNSMSYGYVIDSYA